ADFADHNYIRILAHDRAQAVGERKADLRFNLDLIYTAKLIFHRIFDGNDLLTGIVDLLQGSVERRRFTTTGRPGNEHHPMRLGDHFIKLFEDCGRKTQSIHLSKDLRALQQTNDHAFTVQGGNSGNTEIDIFPRKSDLDASVLGQPALCDIELRQNLSPRNHGCLQLARRRLDFVENAIDAVPDLQLILKGLDLEIRGAHLERAQESLIHHT